MLIRSTPSYRNYLLKARLSCTHNFYRTCLLEVDLKAMPNVPNTSNRRKREYSLNWNFKSNKTYYLIIFYTFRLIALGVEQFLPFIASKPRKFKSKRMQLCDAVQLVCHYMLPCRDALGVLYHIKKRRFAKDFNPIKVRT